MKLNGIELTKKEEINYLRKEKRELYKDLEKADWKKELHLNDSIRYTNQRINHLKNEIKLEKLQAKQNIVRSNYEFDKLQKQIDKLRKELRK